MNHFDYSSLIGILIRKDPEAIEASLSQKNFNFRSFGKFLRANKLSGYTYSILKESNTLKLLPNGIIKELERSYTTQREKNILLIEESEKLQELFDKSESNVIFLKGPFFTLRFFGDLGQRSISDIDVLIVEK